MEIAIDDLFVSPELSRSGSAKQFEERLRSSIEEIGLAEPIKVAPLPEGGYLVVDGIIRLNAIRSIRKRNQDRFKTVTSYVVSFERRFEIRYQTDVYQDLLPSQLAGLVEHLHKAEHVKKTDIARYIGVSPATLRNYTGVWRLLQRGGLFRSLVTLMDVDVFPSSNPYAWLRLTAAGLRHVIEEHFSDGQSAEKWMAHVAAQYQQGATTKYPIKMVESVTDALPAEMYRVGEEVRTIKRDLGLRRAANYFAPPAAAGSPAASRSLGGSKISPIASSATPLPATYPVNASAISEATAATAHGSVGAVAGPIDHTSSDELKNLAKIYRYSREPVLRSVAKSLQEYLG
ncbi:ParB/RepB/Spo0J family partition protein [Actinoplanes sp. CA-142083]|uniref:ParB/RepB/Spo0J family partition protein n=1 Tax=Actinoplanes sp. CA-142083 TaxID=3239903 RepID=UPI003D8A4642